MAAEAIVSGIYDMHLENDVLKLSEDQVLYRDQPIQEGHFKSVAFQSEHRFYVKANKLHYEYNGKCFDVDSKLCGVTIAPIPFLRLFQSKSKK